MKQIIYLALVLVIISGCVSNKSFKIEQAKAQQMEQRQFQLMGQIESMRSDLQTERAALTQIHNNLQSIETLKGLPEEIRYQVNSLNAAVDSLQFRIENKIPLLQDNVDYMMERISTLQDEFADNNKILIELGKNVNTLSSSVQETAPVLIGSTPAKASKVEKTNQPAKTDIYPTHAQTTVSDPISAPKLTAVKLDKVLTLEYREAHADTDTARLLKSYKYAKAKFDARDFTDAIAMFTDLSRVYADDPYAANAQYWIAESYYSMSQYAEALPEFGKVVTNYPTSPKAPDAMLKMGLCYEKTGDLKAAREQYHTIKSIYPSYERIEMVEKLLRLLPN